MSLRVQDLKPGDVVRIDAKVVSAHLDGPAYAYVVVGHSWRTLSDFDLAAGNAELVVRPRPVRKGDKLHNSDRKVRTFLAELNGMAYTVEIAPVSMAYVVDEWTHADGTPIDWEASE